MRNLLLEKHKKKIRREYRLRLLVIACMLLTMVFAFGVAFILPSYLNARSEMRALLEKREGLAISLKRVEAEVPSKLVAATSDQVRALSIPEARPLPSSIIEAIVAAREGGIVLSSFEYRADSKESKEVRLTGRATTRSDLQLFAKNLEAEEAFEQVELPVSDLAENRDIDFSMRVIVTVMP